MRLLADWWDKVWPNLLASVLWVPVTLVHITRSNKKSLNFYLGEKPGPDEEQDDSRD